MNKYFALFAIIGSSLSLSAQDFHLSQFDAADLYMNPGTTGMFKGEPGRYRVSADYRSQWRSLGLKPFSTMYISFDMPLQKYEDQWGVGGFIANNHGAPGQFRTIQVMGSGAYNIMHESREHYLTAGLQMGLIYKSYNQGDFTYDEQYESSSGTFNSALNSGESFSKYSKTAFDAAIGIHYRYGTEFQEYHPFGSFSVQHLAMPNESLTGEKNRMPMRFNFLGGCEMQLKEDFMLAPRILYMNQRKAWEFVIGTMGYYTIKNSSLDAVFGVDYRHKDAVVAHIGFRQGSSIFRFSYDINIAGVNDYTNGKGAWEFSLILVGAKNQPLFKPLF
jgi:type IX secretion system PorP/SprF family membrane protein